MNPVTRPAVNFHSTAAINLDAVFANCSKSWYATKFESKVRNTAGIWNSARALDSIRFIFRSYTSLLIVCMHAWPCMHACMHGWSAPTAASMASSDCPSCHLAELLDQGELAHIFFASPHSPDLPWSNPQTASAKMLKPQRFTKISERIYISSWSIVPVQL